MRCNAAHSYNPSKFFIRPSMNLTKFGTETTIVLPDDLEWKDEFTWSATTSSNTYLLTGALLVQTSTKQAGRPITLESGSNTVYVTRQTVLDLITWAETPEQIYSLEFTSERYVNEEEEEIPGRTFKCIFDYTKNPIQAESLYFIAPYQATDYYKITLNLIEVN